MESPSSRAAYPSLEAQTSGANLTPALRTASPVRYGLHCSRCRPLLPLLSHCLLPCLHWIGLRRPLTVFGIRVSNRGRCWFVPNIQNLVHENGVVARLVDGRAEFLYDREVPPVEVAVEGLEVEPYEAESGRRKYRIKSGVPTWEGQNLEIAEYQINTWGLPAFRRESQHEVRGAAGYFFDETAFRYCKPSEIPSGLRLCRAWDLAATQGGGDWTVGVLMGITSDGLVYILDVQRYQFESAKVRALLLRTAERDTLGKVYGADEVDHRGNVTTAGVERFAFVGRTKIHLPQDPAQAGKDQAEQLKLHLSKFDVTVQPVSGAKAVRARGYADQVNSGNVILVEGEWNHPFTEEHRKYREDEEHEYDDQADAASDAYNEIAGTKELKFY